MTRLCLRGGRIVDPTHGVDAVGDLFIEDGRIVVPAPGDAPADEAIVQPM